VSTFFGLGPAYRPALHKTIFQIVYHSGGGFSFSDVYNLPIWMRRFYMKELEEQNEAQRRASKGKGSSNSRPPGFSSPPSR